MNDNEYRLLRKVKMPLSVLILAAGKGTRMNSNYPKVLHNVGNIPMIYYSIDLAQKLNATNIGVVISEKAVEIRNFIKRLSKKIDLIVQSKQLGTGHAILSAKKFEKKAGDVIILYGDCPLISINSLNNLITARKKGADLAVLGFFADNPKQYGRMAVDENNNLKKIIEFKDATKDELGIKLCNSGVMIANSKILFSLLNQIRNNNSAQEFYLTDIVYNANKEGLNVQYVNCSELEAQGVNNRKDLSEVENQFQVNKRIEALSNGVTLKDPSSTYFSYDTEIGKDTIIEPNVTFGTGVKIKNDVVVKSFSYLEGCEVNSNVTLGPFARIRPKTILDEGVKVGNFVEVKQSHLSQNVKVNHLAYIGDGKIGKNSNIGAGTIFCNYDGYSKNEITISNDTFVGSNVSLVAPLKIGNNVVIGAGSTITNDIKNNELSIGRKRQINKKRKK